LKILLYILALLTVLVPTSGVAFVPVDGTPGEEKNDTVTETGLDLTRAGMYSMLDASTAVDDEISPDEVRSAVESLFKERFPEASNGLDVRIVRMGLTIESASSLRVRLNHSESIPKGHTQVRLMAQNDNAWDDAGWALLYVAHFDSVAIARRDVARGDAVERDDIAFAWMETTTFRGQPLRPGDLRALNADDIFAHRPLRSDHAVRLTDLRPSYVADTGQDVTVTYRRNGVELKMACQARESGFLGDVIRAYSPDTKTTYKVVLTGPGTATWKSTL